MLKVRSVAVLPYFALLLSCQSKPSDPVALSLEYAPLETTPKPDGTELELGLAGLAKIACSAVYVSGRTAEDAIQNSNFFLEESEIPFVRFTVDTLQKTLSLTWKDSVTRTARYYGSQGCIIQRSDGLHFDPATVTSSLPPPELTDWPMGDRGGLSEDKRLAAAATEAADLAFEKGLTQAFLVVRDGRILAERYAAGVGPHTQLESWSMGKSLTATLIGRMIQEGYFDLDDPAPVEAWSQQGDPRGAIRIRDLLNMSSGLRFMAHRDPEVDSYTGYLDHFYIYTGAVDAFGYSYNRPLQYAPGSTGRYRNCDPLALGYIMRTQLEARGLSYHLYPQQELFDKIGIREQVLETDPYGNFLMSGYDYGTVRNWARIGMLYLQDGVWNGERLLPEGFTRFVSTPAPGWEEPEYGGMFWVNGTGEFPVPANSYYAAGAGGQYTLIIPDYNMVVVRMGHMRGLAEGLEAFKAALMRIALEFESNTP
jgi:CubicO group peptidase (beta-lactamase class C family)